MGGGSGGVRAEGGSYESIPPFPPNHFKPKEMFFQIVPLVENLVRKGNSHYKGNYN